MIHVHRLTGCSPTPLAHYLKAIGILRLVAEQADPDARGWWDGEDFKLATELDKVTLEDFFLIRYQPTPMFSPWNKGSGFFAAKDPAVYPVEHSVASRFTLLRAGIAAARCLLNDLAQADQGVRTIKDETKVKGLSRAAREQLRTSPEYKKRLAEAERSFKRLKAEFIPSVRMSWRGAHRDWIDAALVLAEDGSALFPSLLGTGGNDGRLDFTNNFLQRLSEIFDLASEQGAPRGSARQWISGALWAQASIDCRSGCAVGQYLPGSAGGANNANGPEGSSLLNPFDFVLMLEGALVFVAHASRKLAVGERVRASAPFAVDAQSAGYASASDSDESTRGEQWMPLWVQPFRLHELRRLLAEGRAQIGSRPSREPLDLARSIARLGTARGITAFQRFGYIERNGQSNLAVPLGRFSVPEQAATQLDCLDDLDTWLVRLRREARSNNASARLKHAERQLGNALFAVTQHATEPSRWQRVLLALADIEAIQVSGTGFKAGPIPTLRRDWVTAVDDGEPAIRLALALALQTGGFEGNDARWWNSVRRHWLPLDRKRPDRFAQTGSVGHTKLLAGPEIAIHGRSGRDDAIALVSRRLVEGAQHGKRALPLFAAPQAGSRSADLSALIAGEVDLDQVMALARALMALNCRDWYRNPPVLSRSPPRELADDAWLVLRLALLPFPLPIGPKNGIAIYADPAIFRRLASGDAAGALALALRRLRAAGIRSAVRATALSPDTARNWAAALAFPIYPSAATRYLRRLDPTVDPTKED